MSAYRRWYVPGGTYFFTVVTHGRRKILTAPGAPLLLGNILRACRERWPYSVVAMVLLPEHLRAIWTLPAGDNRYSTRWAWIKKEFSKRWIEGGGTVGDLTSAARLRHRAGVWQPRFWEHTIRDEDDLERHVHYIHFNPVKHGLVSAPSRWPYSTFRRWVDAGCYSLDWGSSDTPPPDFGVIESTIGE